MLRLDHIAVSAGRLDEGVAWVEAALGVSLQGGGQHPLMATHNRLLGLGDVYLEVIAPDPTLPRPAHPRWFALDDFTGPPRLTNWIARCDDLEAALALSPPGSGRPLVLSRGDLRWRMAVPDDGHLPFDDAFPALIEWQGAAHPTERLASPVHLLCIEITHPACDRLTAALSGLLDDPRLRLRTGPAKAMRAVFATPQGERVLE